MDPDRDPKIIILDAQHCQKYHETVSLITVGTGILLICMSSELPPQQSLFSSAQIPCLPTYQFAQNIARSEYLHSLHWNCMLNRHTHTAEPLLGLLLQRTNSEVGMCARAPPLSHHYSCPVEKYAAPPHHHQANSHFSTHNRTGSMCAHENVLSCCVS